MRTWSLSLPYRTPPLSLNRQLHRMVEYKIKAQLKQDVTLLARAHKLPHLAAITVELVWLKGDNRKADSDNIAPTLKPCIDALKAARVIDDDDSDHVLRTSTRVLLRRDHGRDGAYVELRIRDMSALAVRS